MNEAKFVAIALLLSFYSRHAQVKSQTVSLSSIATKLENNFLSEGKEAPAIDVTFIIHSSKTITSVHFPEMRKLVVDLLRYFSISRSNTRVALITFGSRAAARFNFNKYLNRKCLASAILSTPYPSKFGSLESAINTASTLYKNARYGRRANSKKLIFILTDQHNRGTSRLKKALKGLLRIRNTKIHAVGIGKALVSSSALYQLGSTFRSRQYHHLTTPTQVKSISASLKNAKPFDTCSSSSRNVFYDECNRRCSCRSGRLHNCKRVRKAMCSMSSAEKTRFLAAYKKLSTDTVYKTRFDNLRILHVNVFSTGIHSKSQFLPWHRWYILEFENMLQEIDCRVTVPYWAWSLRPNDAWSASSIWGVGSDGLGGNGVPAWGCVNSGQFMRGRYNIPNLPSGQRGQCLERGFNGSPPGQVQIAILTKMTDFTNFELYLRANLHDNVHCMIGGTMCTTQSASAPEFFLHHGYVDKLWDDWQKKSSANKNVYFPTISGKMQSSAYQRKDFIRLEAQPGCISVVYDQPNCNNAVRIQNALVASSMSFLRSMPVESKPFDGTKTRKLFVLSRQETAKLAALEDEMNGNMVFSTDISNVIGFDVSRLKMK